jgi:hypothetical protein
LPTAGGMTDGGNRLRDALQPLLSAPYATLYNPSATAINIVFACILFYDMVTSTIAYNRFCNERQPYKQPLQPYEIFPWTSRQRNRPRQIDPF